jgi:hypothetical protein
MRFTIASSDGSFHSVMPWIVTNVLIYEVDPVAESHDGVASVKKAAVGSLTTGGFNASCVMTYYETFRAVQG